MKKFKSFISGVVWTLISLYVFVVVLLHVPAMQRWTGNKVSQSLEQLLGTKVQIGHIDLGFFNRIIIDNVLIYDQLQQKMLLASRLSAKVDLIPLLSDGRIRISSAQLFGMKANLYRKDAKTQPNFQFFLDSLTSRDTTSHAALDLHIQSLIVRNGTVRYNQLDSPQTPHQFNPTHLDITDISTHINLYALTDDTISANVKKFSLKETSGLDLSSLAFKLNAGKHGAVLEDFEMKLPKTHLRVPQIAANYELVNGKIDKSSFRINVSISESSITPCDLAFLSNKLKNFKNSISIEANAKGDASSLQVNGIRINSSTGSIGLKGSGTIADLQGLLRWTAHVEDMKLSADGIRFVEKNLNGKSLNIPDEFVRLGNIRFRGDAYGSMQSYGVKGELHTSAGSTQLDVALKETTFRGDIKTEGINIGHILNNPKLGLAAANIYAEGKLNHSLSRNDFPIENLLLKGSINRFDYNGYSYQNLNIDGTVDKQAFSGSFSMDDPNGQAKLNGTVLLYGQTPSANMTLALHHFNPQKLRLTDALGDRTFDLDATADITGKSIKYANGVLDVNNFTMKGKDGLLHLNNITAKTGYQDEEHFIDVQSDFGNVLIRGQYDYETLPQSFISLIADKLPTLPGLPKTNVQATNDFAMIANIHNADIAQRLFDIPLQLQQPLHLKGALSDRLHEVEMDINAPDFIYDGNHFEQTNIYIATQNDTLVAHAYTDKVSHDGQHFSLDMNASAANNQLSTSLLWDAHDAIPLSGVLNAETEFFKDDQGLSAAHVRIHPSEVFVDQTKWEVQPSDIVYSKNRLNIDHFQVSNNKQHLIVSGLATNHPEDSLVVDLQDIDVAYILNLVNFHSVEFSGFASGQAVVRDILGKPDAQAQVTVSDFHFQDGRMGVLHAKAAFDSEEGQINIDAVADDLPFGETYINGYVSPKKNYIDLGIRADGTRLEFAESFCGSFMDNVDAKANGFCRIYGDLSEINMEGKLVANGTLDIKTLNTTYTLKNDSILMVPDDIIFVQDTIYDRDNHIGIVNGGLHHKHLTRLTFDLNVEAQNLLSYDFDDYGDQVFYGTVYATGNCYIKGRKGEITFDVNATPNENSFIEYNAAGPEEISTAEFIQWRDMTEGREQNNSAINRGRENNGILPYLGDATVPVEIPSDIRMNILINATPDFTLRVLMDEATGDKISLNGEGAIHANYFNKGAFDMFGNYLISNGTYTMTIQNVIKKEFVFQDGSSIIFGGDPFNASLNLKGQYTLPAVSLSDLQMGRSFKQNNTRVNCLMNIEGTAGAPSVTFGLELPTLNSDAQQMVRSVINSEEDMNQQVLYLLAVGRFLPQGSNNATQESTQQSQTSLAMQSLLSGTLSQQINTVLSNVVKSSNWNFGANISTGDEGFSNAEYEGLLSGRLLNNRLLINGEFGYRDNVTTQQSNFIGDFDVQYLLYPNGNLAVKVYNETNDRYFTRNSLTTQGIGLILKKDFTTLRDLLGKKKNKKITEIEKTKQE